MTSSEWVRLAFTVLLCIPLLAFGLYLFGKLIDEMTKK